MSIPNYHLSTKTYAILLFSLSPIAMVAMFSFLAQSVKDVSFISHFFLFLSIIMACAIAIVALSFSRKTPVRDKIEIAALRIKDLIVVYEMLLIPTALALVVAAVAKGTLTHFIGALPSLLAITIIAFLVLLAQQIILLVGGRHLSR